jgi:hypothetical protein
MADFTGGVTFDERKKRYVFDNDDGTTGQRLTRAKLGGDYAKDEIDLKEYDGQQIRVSGDEQHDWIIEAKVLNDK